MTIELEKTRAFVGQTEEKRRVMEESVKGRYSISDWETENGKGYKIYDTKKEKDIYFDSNARLTLETRYLEKDKKRKPTENVLDLFARVAVNIAEADLKYKPKKNIKPVAEGFLESLVYKEFMPNTPTLCNAGRSLQQLAACFVLPIEDYLATDDIGEDPEKQGMGIYDTLRYMAMVHKSGGGTGFNFGHLRPRSDRISTTFGSSSGPVSFSRVFNSSTDEVNQGGFRRGANMAILPYIHPDIFEFISEKARTGGLENFNLSVGVDDEFMGLVKDNGYFRLINPKDENNIPLEQRVWGRDNLLSKNDLDYNTLFKELNPSLIIEEDDKSVINVYTGKQIGKIDEDGSALISARSLFDYITENAWISGCPGIVFLDRLERNNKTPHIGKIESTNPCGEQPLLPFEACNLGGTNLATCVKEVEFNNDAGRNGVLMKKEVDYNEIKRRVYKLVHFLDNTIDMSKFPFQKLYGMVHGNRKIGLGLMGWAEMLVQLNIAYDSQEAINFAKDISSYITTTAREKSHELAKERGVFPFWKGSVFEEQGEEYRNATTTTIAPNGTTGMICGVTGGIEPFFKLAFKKTCMDGKELIYRTPFVVQELERIDIGKKELERILNEIDEKGSLKDYEVNVGSHIRIKELKNIYKTSHEISPEWHVKMQAAFQVGKDGVGVDNAVSKTVNLPEEATVEDVKKTYWMSYNEGCMGVTIFRDNSKEGVYSGLEKEVELMQDEVKLDSRIDKKAQAIKYKVRRHQNKDSLHIILTSDLYVDDENKKAYFIPVEIFQERAPLGHSISVSFSQSGMDRTEILRGQDPDYAELVERLQSASSNEEEGIGPNKIKSIEHATGLILEDYLLRNNIIKQENGNLINVIRKSNLRKVKEETDEYKSVMSQGGLTKSNEELFVMGTFGKLGNKFVCGACGNEEYTFEAGCNHPKCAKCGEIQGGGCG